MSDYSVTLSTTEPNNYVGLIKLRQGDVASQSIKATITANGQLFNFDHLAVFFNAVLPNGNVIRDKATNVDYANSKLNYIVADSFLQEVAQVTAWFSFENDEKIIDSTKNFQYSVIGGWKECIPQGNYIYELSEIQREIEEIISNKDFSSLLKKMNTFSTNYDFLNQTKADKSELKLTNTNLSTQQSRIDNLIINSNSGANSNEVVDMRIDGLGVGHPISGDSTRSIYSVLKNRMLEILFLATFELGRFDAASGAKVASTTQARTTNKINLPTGTNFTARSKGDDYYFLVWEYDNAGKFMKYTQYLATEAGIKFSTTYPLINFSFIFRAGFTQVDQVKNSFTIQLPYNDYTDTVKTTLQNEIDLINNSSNFSGIQNELDAYGTLSANWQFGKLADGDGGEYPSGSLIRTDFLSTNNLPKLLHFKHLTTDQIFVKVFYYDENKKYTGESNPIADDATLLITSNYFRIEMTGKLTTDSRNINYSILQKTPYFKGKLSILGDSISTYDGFIPSDATAFYPKGKITNVNRTYWKMLMDMLGMTLEKNNSYSSSTVTSSKSFTPLSDDSRLSNLGSPDVILVEGGTNDIYAGKNKGVFNGVGLSKLDLSDFTQACTKVISRLQAEHPNAKIIWLTPSFIDNTGVYNGRVNCTIERTNDICNAIIEVCGMMGVEFIDMRKVGLTLFNFDALTIDHLHWDYDFTKIIAEKIYQKLNGNAVSSSKLATARKLNDGVINTIAYANSADGTDGFTTVYPNLNLLDGTKDFSGSWERTWGWENDGTYKGLTVKKRTGQWDGIYKTFTAPKDGTYTFSAYIKSSGNNANITRYADTSVGHIVPDKSIGNNFDWLRDSFSVTLKAGYTVTPRYEISGSGSDSILWTAGHKWEPGSTATPYMPSSSEVTTADYPKYVGFSNIIKPNKKSSDYKWLPM